MKALVLAGRDDIGLRDVADPQPHADEVVVRVEYAGVCGTDVHGYAQGAPLRHPPIIMGHEFCGTIGGSGDRVVVNPRVICGTCAYCKSGREQLCEDASTIGVNRPGGFAEFVAVPPRNCVPIPDELDSRLAALTEPLAVGLHGANILCALSELEGLRVGVVGGGVVGLAVALIAQRRGAVVSIVDRSPDRQEQARRHGIVDVGDGLAGEFAVTVEAVGSRTAREATTEHLAAGGHALWIGLDAVPAQVDVPFLIRGERSIITSYCYTEAEFAEAVGLCREFDVEELGVVSLDEGTSVFGRLHTDGGPHARTIFKVGGAQCP